MPERDRSRAYQVRRCALLIDGAHLQDCLVQLHTDVDFRKLRAAFPEQGMLSRAVYLCLHNGEEASLTRLADWLSYHGYDAEVVPAPSRRNRDLNTRVPMAVQAMSLAQHVDTLIMIAGDDDYKALVIGIQQMGPRVVVVSTRQGRKIGDALRRQADDFIDLLDLLPRVARGESSVSTQVMQ